MTAREIQRTLIVGRYARSFVLNNYTPSKWWECDVFEVTKARYFKEYEIKLSLADFKADADKLKEGWRYNEETGKGETFLIANKHQMLSAGQPPAPSQFYFVCPVGIIPIESIPDWAGLIYMRERDGGNPREETMKEAPKLHKIKTEPSFLDHARGVCYWRMHNLFLHRKLADELITNP